MGIHNYERAYERTKGYLSRADISDRNKEIIREFIADLVLDGISKPRIIKYVYNLKKCGKIIEKDFDKAKVEDVKRFIKVVQESDYSDWTKHEYKITVRKFFKWLKKTREYPEEVAWISLRWNRSKRSLPSEGDLLTEEDVKSLIGAAETLRDKVYI